MSAIQISHLSKSFTTQPVLNDVSWHIRHGEFVAVLGPSGCGKTTLLRTIAGFEPVSSGTITVGDRLFSSSDIHVAPEKRDLGIVFQNYALWPHMSVEENVAYSLKVAGMDRNERRIRTQDALALVGLGDYATRRPADLSGGQRQRVALARCLVTRPGVVLLDEPLANLDVHLRAAMEEEFSRFHQHTGATLLYITHDQQEAMAIADRVVVMNEGKVMQFATPQTLYREPANAMVASFIDDGRVIPAQNILPAESGSALGTDAVDRHIIDSASHTAGMGGNCSRWRAGRHTIYASAGYPQSGVRHGEYADDCHYLNTSGDVTGYGGGAADCADQSAR